MKQHTTETQWMGDMQFNALVQGHTIVMDTLPASGGADAGPIPKPLILAALSGCTAMDVASLLRKEKKQVKDFSIRATGELTEKHPITYLSIHLVYDFKGEPEFRYAAMQAVTLSQEKYCGVSHMLKKALPVTWEVHYNGERLFNNNESILQKERESLSE